MTAVADLVAARAVADAVLYEGYVLFPYRASAVKNRYRWQFGVVIPQAQATAGTAEPAEVRSDVLLRGTPDAQVTVTVRALRVRRREVQEEVDGGFRTVDALDVHGDLMTTWDEGVEQEVVTGPARLADLVGEGAVVRVHLGGTSTTDSVVSPEGTVVGRVVRSSAPLSAVLRVSAEPLDDDVVRLTSTLRNTTAWADPDAARDEVVRRSLTGCHLLLAVDGGRFASVQDPPAWAAPWVGALDNRATHPVLASPDDDLVLSAPIILADHPAVATESPGDAYDATEIDELLALTTRALSDDERREAVATDPRAAAVVERAAALPPEVMSRLHGAIRELGPVAAPSPGPGPKAPAKPAHADALDADLAAFFGVDEEPLREVTVDGRVLAVGDRLRLRPRHRADAQDLFARDRVARLERIERDVDGDVHLGVTLEDDPAAELTGWSGRFRYFRPDEVEPVGPSPADPERRS